MEQPSKVIHVGEDSYECNVDPNFLPIIERHLCGSTDQDLAVDALPIPIRPISTMLAVRSIRWYQRVISPKMGSRCVMDPSCSHFAELAIREHGIFKSAGQIYRRLRECKPINNK